MVQKKANVKKKKSTLLINRTISWLWNFSSYIYFTNIIINRTIYSFLKDLLKRLLESSELIDQRTDNRSTASKSKMMLRYEILLFSCLLFSFSLGLFSFFYLYLFFLLKYNNRCFGSKWASDLGKLVFFLGIKKFHLEFWNGWWFV